MNREQFITEITNTFANIDCEDIDRQSIKQKYRGKNGRPGIYLLFNDEKQVIYIGKVGKGNKTSFYARLYGHGSGSHHIKSWFSECKYFKFKQFPYATGEDLIIIERLMIYSFGQPRYNDIGKFLMNYKEILERTQQRQVEVMCDGKIRSVAKKEADSR